MNREKLFRKAIDEISMLASEDPSFQTGPSIIAQLTYLLGLETKAISDRSRLKDIILGIQAVREVEPRNTAIADTLYQVSGEIGRMLTEG
jgi:hypothetical protein